MEIKGKVLNGKILIKPDEAEKKTASGLIIPEKATDKPKKGTVVLVGQGKQSEQMEVSVGDVVCYNKYSGIELTVS